jgi:UDP-N-acetylglucosamine transferase subunit ALG13
MIYVTVGTQLPFDRLINIVNFWAESTNENVIAQVGPTESDFSHIDVRDFYSPLESGELFSKADVIVSHAGMGSILTACERGKIIIIFPRRFEFAEHRNDHQLATAKKFEGLSNVFVAYDEDSLIKLLNDKEILSGHANKVSKYAPDYFIDKIESYL